MIALDIKTLYIVLDLILPLAVGYLCRYQRRCGEPFFRGMISINIFLVYPVLTTLTFWVLRLDYALLGLPLFGLVLSAVPGLAAYLWSAARFTDYLERGSYIIAAILSNIGTLGGLCAFIIYGEIGFAYTQLIVLLQSVVMFMFCYPLAQYYYQKSLGGGKQRADWREIILHRNQLPVLGLFLGVWLSYAGVPRPAALGGFVAPLIHIGAWTALVPVGFSIDPGEMRRCYRQVLDLIPIKFLLTPLVAYGLARTIFSDAVMINTVVIIASMPTAINAVITAKLYNLNPHIAMAAFGLTTAAFLLLVFPLMLWILR